MTHGTMEKIGTIAALQVQQSALKSPGTDGRRIYDPAAILRLQQIQLTAAGIIGLTASGGAVMDVHHVRHPHSRFRGDNKISLCFTASYDQMRDEWGSHIRDGIGGENIIVDSRQHIAPADMGTRIAIHSSAAGRLIHLSAITPIPPCEPFSRYVRAKALSAAETKATLQFLSQGMRGYYMEAEAAGADCILQTGDAVYRA